MQKTWSRLLGCLAKRWTTQQKYATKHWLLAGPVHFTSYALLFLKEVTSRFSPQHKFQSSARVACAVQVVPMHLARVEWDQGLYDYIEHWVGVLPAPAGALSGYGNHYVTYTVEAWSTRSMQRWRCPLVHEAIVGCAREVCFSIG
jgi:hypothetical protein